MEEEGSKGRITLLLWQFLHFSTSQAVCSPEPLYMTVHCLIRVFKVSWCHARSVCVRVCAEYIHVRLCFQDRYAILTLTY